MEHRFRRHTQQSLRWTQGWDEQEYLQQDKNVALDCGWGRLIFAQTFVSPKDLIAAITQESQDRRDMAFYVRDPHVLLALAPQELFLDPSHTYRLWLSQLKAARPKRRGFSVRLMQSREDAQAINRLYRQRKMVPAGDRFIWEQRQSREHVYLLAEDRQGEVLGCVTGIDHVAAFGDEEQGSSLWCLAVSPDAALPGVGEALVRHLAELMQARGRAYLDLSVIHDNQQAIALYEKLGFQRAPVFCMKRKNPINRPLFIGPQQSEDDLNPYARIIVDEALRRGIRVEVDDSETGMLTLEYAGRRLRCRESLTDLTSAVVLKRCDDKRLTHKLLAQAGLSVPAQCRLDADAKPEQAEAFLRQHQSVVVKPLRGEQGAGISVDIRDGEELKQAMQRAFQHDTQILLEEYVSGQDLRVVVIDYQVVAAAVRVPPTIYGNGQSSIEELIRKLSRRRRAASDGESHIPLDAETRRCVAQAGYQLDQVLPHGQQLLVRKTANLHTGGHLQDVTQELHPALKAAAIDAARCLEIPVVGMDMIVSSPRQAEYAILEANERPGLANHEPQPTAEKFIDLLFPETRHAQA